jgi:ribosomal protein S18 acetylase RimI-like enzyme
MWDNLIEIDGKTVKRFEFAGMELFQDIKQRIAEPEVGVIISYAALDDSPEGVAKEAAMYLSSDNLNFYGWVEDDRVVGICGFEVHGDKVEIQLISVAEDRQRQGIGGAMVAALQKMYGLPLEAETVEEAVGFYRKRGFTITAYQHPEWGEKYTCVLEAQAVFTTEELAEAHRALSSTLKKCEKIDIGKMGKSQQTLLERRIAAFKLALALIEKEQEHLNNGRTKQIAEHSGETGSATY